VHGHSNETLALQPVFAKIAPDFLCFIGADRLVIHNAEFDIGFLNAELARLGGEPIAPSRVVDTLAIARRKHPGAPNSLDALCDRYRIDRSRRVRHGALLDAEILVEIYGELLGGRQRSLIFVAPRPESRATAQSAAQPIARARAAVISLITEAERAAHALHVAALGDEAVWRRYLPEPAE
jgi:DNA polymerase-3 subunit epsilon